MGSVIRSVCVEIEPAFDLFDFSVCSRSIDWLIAWVIRLPILFWIDRLITWMIDWLIDGFIGWSCGYICLLFDFEFWWIILNTFSNLSSRFLSVSFSLLSNVNFGSGDSMTVPVAPSCLCAPHKSRLSIWFRSAWRYVASGMGVFFLSALSALFACCIFNQLT